MAWRIFTGAVDTDFNTTGNWDPATVPVSGDEIICGGEAVRSLVTNVDNQGAKTFDQFILDAAFAHSVGDGSTALTCTITNLYIASPSALFSHSGVLTRANIASSSTAPGSVKLNSLITELYVSRGSVLLTGTRVAAASSRIHVQGAEASLTINENQDLITNSTSILVASGGYILSEANIKTLTGVGGRFRLGRTGTKEPTAVTVDISNCLFEWLSDGTITQGHVRDGAIFQQFDAGPRTLTNLSLYGNGIADLRKGFATTLTNPIRVYGEGVVQSPPGMTIQIAA